VSGFDWSPFLQAGESLLWQARHNKRRLALMIVPMIALFSAVPLLDDGTGDEKFRIVAFAAPLVVAFLVVCLAILLVTDDRYALTTRRALAVQFAPWLRRPKVTDCPLDEVTVRKYPKTPLMFVDRLTNRIRLNMTLPDSAVAEVMHIVNARHG
jgi:hypothetical protein